MKDCVSCKSRNMFDGCCDNPKSANFNKEVGYEVCCPQWEVEEGFAGTERDTATAKSQND